MVQPSQQHVALYVKGVEWVMNTRSLRMVAAIWAGIPVSLGYIAGAEVTQEAGVVPRRRRVAIGTPF